MMTIITTNYEVVSSPVRLFFAEDVAALVVGKCGNDTRVCSIHTDGFVSDRRTLKDVNDCLREMEE
jgi:hypothetical protein